MLNQSTTNYQYDIIVDILAEMVTNYLVNKEEESKNQKKGDSRNAY
ncbi:hypothetical protein ACD650_18340 [Bacillus anthracis]|nr:hypothetical protein [Bacillus cereus group sp. BfR-BA-01331]